MLSLCVTLKFPSDVNVSMNGCRSLCVSPVTECIPVQHQLGLAQPSRISRYNKGMNGMDEPHEFINGVKLH